MANMMRWRYGDTNPVTSAVDSSTVIEIGDLVLFCDNRAIPASRILAVPYGSPLATMQRVAHAAFLGVAMQTSEVGDTGDIRIATSGVFEFDQNQATVEVGTRIGIDCDLEQAELIRQQVIAVPADAPERSIGRCARKATESMKILIAICSTVMNDGPQQVAQVVFDLPRGQRKEQVMPESSKILVIENKDGSMSLEIDGDHRGNYASQKIATMHVGLCLVRIDDLEAGAAVFQRAIKDSGYDMSPCGSCGKTIVCIPDGLPMCETCAMAEGA